jgi:hypothetical protein
MAGIPRSTIIRRGVTVAAAALTLTFIGFGARPGAAGSPAAPNDVVTPTTQHHTVGGITTGGPKTPPAPQRLTSSGLRPLTRSEADRLRGAIAHGGDPCIIDFDDDEAIALLPYNYAESTFVYSPWWNQKCGGNYARVYPTDDSHYHLGYSDPDVTTCSDPDNPYDTPVGVFSRGDDCEPIDPLTEPRSHIIPHLPSTHIRLDLIDPIGSAYKPQPFTLEQVRILYGPVRVCYRMPPEGPWVAAAPVGPFDLPGLVYCWASLGTGTWDLSDWTVGTVDVSFTGANGSVWGLDDLHLG